MLMMNTLSRKRGSDAETLFRYMSVKLEEMLDEMVEERPPESWINFDKMNRSLHITACIDSFCGEVGEGYESEIAFSSLIDNSLGVYTNGMGLEDGDMDEDCLVYAIYLMDELRKEVVRLDDYIKKQKIRIEKEAKQ